MEFATSDTLKERVHGLGVTGDVKHGTTFHVWDCQLQVILQREIGFVQSVKTLLRKLFQQ